MSSRRTWTVKYPDGTTDSFQDIRRKVGNRVIRAYLLSPLLKEGKIERVKASLRGPKNEFKDFAKFIIVRISDKEIIRVLVEAAVYDNLRIVATDNADFASKTPDDIIRIFTKVLKESEQFRTILIMSEDSVVKVE